jgi:hypothetical protein
MSPANNGPNLFHQWRTVSWQNVDAALEKQVLDVAQR